MVLVLILLYHACSDTTSTGGVSQTTTTITDGSVGESSQPSDSASFGGVSQPTTTTDGSDDVGINGSQSIVGGAIGGGVVVALLVGVAIGVMCVVITKQRSKRRLETQADNNDPGFQNAIYDRGT